MANSIREAMCSRGILASLSISTWSGNKLDKTLTKKQQTDARAIEGAVRVHKSLISDARIKEPSRVAGEARRLHAELTLPWHYDGVGLIPADMVVDYDAKMGRLKNKFWEAVQAVEDGYGDMVRAAALELGDAFDPDDYPHISRVRTFYNWACRFERIPTTSVDDLRLEMPEEAVEIIRDQISNEHEHVVRAVLDRMATTMDTAISRLEAREENESARLHGSTFDKLADLPDVMRKFNITNSEEIEDLLDDLSEIPIDLKELKEDDDVRAETIVDLNGIRDKLKAFASVT